jgi:hypothetical protein
MNKIKLNNEETEQSMKTEMEKRKKTVFQITREFNNHDRHCGI